MVCVLVRSLRGDTGEVIAMKSAETIKSYRQAKNLTQAAFAVELSENVKEGYTKSVVSYMETGLVGVPRNVLKYIEAKMPEKAVRTGVGERKVDDKVFMSPSDKNTLKTAIFPNWHDKGLSQVERVLSYMEDQGSITTKEAFDQLGIARLASRIHDITCAGYEIDKITETSLNRFGKKVHYTRYSMRNGDGQEDMDRQRHMV
jgi:transcriptional regulator with XRE-family HTH domain